MIPPPNAKATLILTALALSPATSSADQKTRRTSVMVLGNASPSSERLVKRELAQREIDVIAAPSLKSVTSPASTVHIQHAQKALGAAKNLYYEVRASEAAVILKRAINEAYTGLVLAQRFDLLRELILWQALALSKAGDAAAAKTFERAITLDDRRLDAKRFGPRVVEAFDTALGSLSKIPMASLTLDVSPSYASILVDGKPLTPKHGHTIHLRHGTHWVLSQAVGFVSDARKIEVHAGGARLAIHLQPASRSMLLEQLAAMKARGSLNTTRRDVATSMGRLQGSDEVLIVDERRTASETTLSLVRVRSESGQLIASHAEMVKGGSDMEAALRRSFQLVWLKSKTPPDRAPFYKTWWFWTAAGVVVAGGATAIILSVTAPPDTYTIKLAP